MSVARDGARSEAIFVGSAIRNFVIAANQYISWRYWSTTFKQRTTSGQPKEAQSNSENHGVKQNNPRMLHRRNESGPGIDGLLKDCLVACKLKPQPKIRIALRNVIEHQSPTRGTSLSLTPYFDVRNGVKHENEGGWCSYFFLKLKCEANSSRNFRSSKHHGNKRTLVLGECCCSLMIVQ